VGRLEGLLVIVYWLQVLRFRVQLVRLERALGQSLASLERVVGVQLADAPNVPLAPGACLGAPVPVGSR
jgi:hypothetical protein